MGKGEKYSKKKDQLYRPYQKKQKLKKIEFKLKKEKYNSLAWRIEEDKLYVKFLEQNKSAFEDKKERKRSKVFIKMSQQIKSRSPDQCRSHHQKMEIKYNDVETIIKAIKTLKLDAIFSQDLESKAFSEQISEKVLQKMEKNQRERYHIDYRKQKQSEDFHVMKEIDQERHLDIWKFINEEIWLSGPCE